MPKTSEFLHFPLVEQELIAAVLKAESFRDTAWADFGADWVQHIPQDINAFTFYYFGIILFPYQVAAYYCPVAEATIVGGRGSGKTAGLALVAAVYHALHPGEDLLHVSITKDQAKKSFDSVLQLGASAGDHVRFVERFIDHTVSMPFPDIFLKRWGPDDPGTVLRYRGVGDESIERLRSYEAGQIFCDEFFRDVPTEDTARQLRGCIRGPNRYRLNQMPAAERDRLTLLLSDVATTPDPEYRAELEAESERLHVQYNLKRRGFMLLYGNAGPHAWSWSRFERARSDPQNYWSFRATSYDNPYFGKENIAALERSFGDNDELRDIEMLAQRPRSLGSIFRQSQIKRCTNPALLPLAEQAYNRGEDGYFVHRHVEFGVYHYQVPKIPGHSYLICADPGSGLAPLRNKWAILAFDISVVPCQLVYYEIGYLDRRQMGDYLGFIQKIKLAAQIYPCAPGDIWVESTGPQMGMVQVVWPEGLTVTPVTLTSAKMTYINFTIQLMGHGYLEWPDIEQFQVELGNYDLPDKDLMQDIVMALICGCGGIWRYYGQAWETVGAETEPVTTQTLDRQLRPLARSHRIRGTRH